VCTEAANTINALVTNRSITRTNIIVGEQFFIDQGVPVISGCKLEFLGVNYNLEQIISYSGQGNILTLRFP
ncbi:MAG: hypothetical protein AAF840_12760, partial [Bacteroidota bacterium]